MAHVEEMVNAHGQTVRVVRYTAEELAAHEAERAVVKRNAAITAQITALESQITPRRIREAVLETDGGWLRLIEADIAALRSQIV